MAKKHRAYWKGYLRLSLVTIGVEVYNACKSRSDSASQKRLNYSVALPE